MPKVPPAATALQAPGLTELIALIAADYPAVSFVEGSRFSWHAGHGRVAYPRHTSNTVHGIFSLLHEVGHAIKHHKDYTHDIELLQLEVAAWDQARLLAERYRVELDEDYIQDCLDTYRDWLHLRATCPACFGRSLQVSRSTYRCHNCGTQWSVSRSRLCRPYRLKTPTPAAAH